MTEWGWRFRARSADKIGFGVNAKAVGVAGRVQTSHSPRFRRYFVTGSERRGDGEVIAPA